MEKMGRRPGGRLSFGARGEEILELVRKVDSGSVGMCLDTVMMAELSRYALKTPERT